MKLVLWDWNGTLVNDAPIAAGAFNDLISAYGHEPVSLERYREIYGHPIRRMYDAVGFDLSGHCFEQLSHEYHEFYKARATAIALHHDAVETLQYVADQGKRQAILSALPHELLPHAVRHHGIDHFFESISGLQDKRGDSKVQLGHEVIERLGVSGHELIMVGDSTHDAEVAASLGAACVLIARGLESRPRLEANGVPVLDSFARLPEYLRTSA
jgi:phosphoglycolate phosphatase